MWFVLVTLPDYVTIEDDGQTRNLVHHFHKFVTVHVNCIPMFDKAHTARYKYFYMSIFARYGRVHN